MADSSASLGRGTEVARTTGEVWWSPELFRLIGVIGYRNGDTPKAIEAFRRSWRLAYRESVTLTLRSTLSLSRLLGDGFATQYSRECLDMLPEGSASATTLACDILDTIPKEPNDYIT
jgi:hypothetical protein